MDKREQFLPNFVALDIETTGFNSQTDKIIEIGAVKYVDNSFFESFEQLIDPERHLPYEITKLTGISRDDLRGKPIIEQVIPKFQEFIGDLPVVAHNAPFDISFLRENGISFQENEIVDTLILARIFLPHLRDHKLITLLKYFKIKIGKSHRAYDDAVSTASLLFNLLELTKELTTDQASNILNLVQDTGSEMIPLLKDIVWQAIHLRSTGKRDRNLSKKLEKMYHFPENIIGDVPLEKSEGTSLKSLDSQDIAEIFFENGLLGEKFRNYEKRKQQIEMARSVTEALNQSSFLMAEAGTGTGKSFAYLVPAIYWATKNKERVIVSTKTKNLQDQLFLKDIPLIKNILEKDFSAVLLKGRENYLCKRKWEAVLSAPGGKLTPEERESALPLVLWADYTKSGDISENNGFHYAYNIPLWKKLNCDRHTCLNRECRYFDNCFMRKVRLASINAHLVVINHYLFFSDLASQNKILGKYGYLIFDEAHNIEDVATDFMGIKLNIWDFRTVLNALYKHGAHEGGMLVGLRTDIIRGQLPSNVSDALKNVIEKLIGDCKDCEREVNLFFQSATEYLAGLPKDPYYPFQKVRYKNNHPLLKNLKEAHEDLAQNISLIIDKVDSILNWLTDIKKEQLPSVTNYLDDLEVYRTDFQSLLDDLNFLMAAEDENFVFWIESPRKDGSFDARFFSAPLSISHVLNDLLYENVETVIFTSATLTVGRSFDFFKKRLGLNLVPPERFVSIQVGSPFRYDKQVMVCVPSYLPSPKSGRRFNEDITEFILKVTAYSRKGSLALFTSYSMLNHVYDNLKNELEADGIVVLGQGVDGSNQQILEEFKEIHESLLLGTSSFWEGVDVPGDSLQLLFVTKLPFASPSEPIIQARTEAIEKEGGNSFMEYSIPMAVIQFRQGFGRLIRSKNDTGVVFVLDNRVVKTRYGRIFLQSLPLRHTEFRNAKALGRSLKNWLLSH